MATATLAPPPTSFPVAPAPAEPAHPCTVLLRQHERPELRALSVSVSPYQIVLTGRVTSFYLKQLAQECVRPAAGGRLVVNRIAVRA